MFAAVNGNVIYIYSVTSFENILNLKGHNGKVSHSGECIIQHESPPHCPVPLAGQYLKSYLSNNWAAVTIPRQKAAIETFFAGAWHWMEPGWQPAGVMRDGWRGLRVEHTDRQAWVWERPQVLQLHRCCLLFRLQDHPGCGNRPHAEGDPRLSGQ